MRLQVRSMIRRSEINLAYTYTYTYMRNTYYIYIHTHTHMRAHRNRRVVQMWLAVRAVADENRSLLKCDTWFSEAV